MAPNVTTPAVKSVPLALALSGGGIRAMAFHAGVLRFLAEQGQLEAVSQISTVSGGSLLVGLVFTRSGMKWPDSGTYITDVLPGIRQTLTCSDLQATATARLLFWPPSWRYVLSRANIMAQTITSLWKIRAMLSDLPARPVWSINGTTAETGKRFRFKSTDFGDYELGYAGSARFPLSAAMAVSAAFPVGIGPLAIRTRDHVWMKRSWGARKSDTKVTRPPYRHIHVYDGGVYDNLGLEPLYDAGQGAPKGTHRIIVSDAGRPLVRGFDIPALHPFRLGRLMDVISDQTRSLRVRGFVEHLRRHGTGAYLQIGMSGPQILAGIGPPTPCRVDWRIDESAIDKARHYPTNLSAIEPEMFDLLERHGYEVALASQLTYDYL